MDISDLDIDDRVEVYTPTAGTYWGYVTVVHEDSVTLDDVAPAGRPTTARAETITRRVFRGRRPAGHVGC